MFRKKLLVIDFMDMVIRQLLREKNLKQAWAEQGQAQLKLEVGLCFTSFKTRFIKLINLFTMY